MAIDPSDALRIEPVTGARLRDQVFRLRYRAYLEAGEIAENRSHLFHDGHDEQSNQLTWALFDGSRLSGTLRSAIHLPTKRVLLPEHLVFGDRIKHTIPSDARIVSASRLAIDPAARRGTRRLVFALLQRHLALAVAQGDWAIAAVSLHHVAFCERVMMMRVGSEPRFEEATNSAMTLMSVPVRECLAAITIRHPLLRVTDDDLYLLAPVFDSCGFGRARPAFETADAG